METSSTMQHYIQYFHRSVFALPFSQTTSMKSFLIVSVHSSVPGCWPFPGTNVLLARRMQQAWFCLTIPSWTNWAKIPAVKHGKANQFSSALRIMQSEKCVVVVVILNTIYCRGKHIHCQSLYLSFFVSILLEAGLGPGLCLWLFTTGSHGSRRVIKSVFAVMCYHTSFLKNLLRVCMCLTGCDTVRSTVFN